MRLVLVVSAIVIVLGAATDGEAQPAPTAALVVRDARGSQLGRLALLTMLGPTPEAATIVTSTGHMLTLSMSNGLPSNAGTTTPQSVVFYPSKDCTGQGYSGLPNKIAIPRDGNGEKFVATSGTSARITQGSVLGSVCSPASPVTADMFPAQILTRTEIGLPKIAPPLSIQ